MNQKLFFTLVIVLTALSGWAHYFTHSAGLQFVTTSAAIIMLAALLGKATENVAHYAGERVGGFLNATFGNAAELIIAIFLIKEGLFDMVKASITGSIIGNLLLVLGLSVIAGGLKFKQQRFNPMLAGHNASLMLLAVIALFIPAVFLKQIHAERTETLSLIISGLLIIAYILWLFFSMVTHKEELADKAVEEEAAEGHMWGKGTSILILIVATVFVAITSEWLVHSIKEVAAHLGWSEIFVGAFVIAIVGNAAEHSAAVFLAMKNKIGASVEIAVGSSLQIALFVAPTLVFVSLLFGKPMDLVFTSYELAAIGVGAFIASSISRDGSTNWYEGVLLVIVYIILGAAFYFLA
ncbi:calcium/proton exchanger [Aneurinibacillus aneurinilyticus]|uniref:Ca(2+)/H(+) antiporter n=2 Tax=Aneurinibacillus aneurinilyticus TaxID=1391 RepID=A0A848CVK9_ANEAE|nr:calcium/proton exchanger [Aneurinibacillus aneurinilyticus]ERI10512.1 calcium/proton exchanger [Aneurinibacillus aneurinilyticus ATCC 12856]MED0709062.1 calcium/proton exchanger [Aneurinibacillus aneurinilyticus]MED0725456.1 calcium/proton exchanger [Aneurinibacillus aneurinilyticus]MED0730767.1 calcium/proton exchanger [Aneurinibacillus aneurinilyticus]MED0740889.1 calcium/proton exchanger [Aneurinibacillus aneurinilyticus]